MDIKNMDLLRDIEAKICEYLDVDPECGEFRANFTKSYWEVDKNVHSDYFFERKDKFDSYKFNKFCKGLGVRNRILIYGKRNAVITFRIYFPKV
jgi:hypothetical protein